MCGQSLQMLGRGLWTYHSSQRIFEKLTDNFPVDCEECGLFFDFQCGFWPSRSTVDLSTVIADSIARAGKPVFCYYVAVAVQIKMVMLAGHVHKLKSYGISSQIFLNFYLATPRPTLGHYRGDSMANLILTTALSTILTRMSSGAS